MTIFLRQCGMKHTHGVSTPVDPNVKLDFAEDWVEKELDGITDYQTVVGSLIYTAIAIQLAIVYAVAALSRYNLRPFTSHTTLAKRVLQYVKSIGDFRLHFMASASASVSASTLVLTKAIVS
jgi:hypothetical protein